MSPDRRVAEAVATLKSLPPDVRVGQTDLPYPEVLRHAAERLGPFALLPASLRGALLRFFCEDEEVSTLARGILSTGLAYAGAALSRPLYFAERLAGRIEARTDGWRKARAAGVRVFLRRQARQAARAPFVLRGRLHRAAARLRLRLGRRDLPTVLRAREVDARPLGFDYLEGLPQLRGCEAVLQRAAPRATFGSLLGLDFVRSEGRYWFLEANWNPSLMDQRLSLYAPDKDPWVNQLLACTTARGYRRLVVYGYRPFSPGHAAALIAGGRRAGVEVEIVDDFFSSGYPGHRRARFMEEGRPREALIVRAKPCDVLFDRALTWKWQTRRIVEPGRRDWGAQKVAFPRLLSPGDRAPHYRPESPYPNIVAKRDGLDRGAGVSFFKLQQVPLGLDIDFFEEYRVPDPCPYKVVRGQPVPIGGAARTWKIRTFALLVPDRVEYLSAIKVISGLTVPERLADGAVARKNIFVVTVNEGGFYSAVTPAEDEEYAVPTRAVCEVLLAWLKRKHADVDAAVDRRTGDAVAACRGAARPLG